jgi:hypothetical protein
MVRGASGLIVALFMAPMLLPASAPAADCVNARTGMALACSDTAAVSQEVYDESPVGDPSPATEGNCVNARTGVTLECDDPAAVTEEVYDESPLHDSYLRDPSADQGGTGGWETWLETWWLVIVAGIVLTGSVLARILMSKRRRAIWADRLSTAVEVVWGLIVLAVVVWVIVSILPDSGSSGDPYDGPTGSRDYSNEDEPSVRSWYGGSSSGWAPDYYGGASSGGDLDCSDMNGPVSVGASDPNGLDADGDGVGCEPYP